MENEGTTILMKVLWRFLLLVVYCFGWIKLDDLLRKHFPPPSKTYVPGVMRFWTAILLLWGPTLWFVPGLLWLNILSFDFWPLLGLSLLIPLYIHIGFMIARGMFPRSPASDFGATTISIIVLVVLGIVCFKTGPPIEGVNKIYFVGFLGSLAIPAWFVNTLFNNSLPQMIPDYIDNTPGVRLMQKMVCGYYTLFPKPVWFVQDGKLETALKGNALLGAGVSLLTTEPENVTGRKKGPHFAGVGSPGTILVDGGLTPKTVIDLRNQIRVTKVTCLTRDGIEVRVPVSSLFRIDWRKRVPLLGDPWPFSRSAANTACMTTRINPVGKTPLDDQASHNWDDLPLLYAQRALRRAIQHYTLEQLYGPSLAQIVVAQRMPALNFVTQMRDLHRLVADDLNVVYTPDPDILRLTRLVIGRFVQDYVRRELTPLGYEILGGGIGGPIVPTSPKIRQELVDGWSALFLAEIVTSETMTNFRHYSLTLAQQEQAFDLFYNTFKQTVLTNPNLVQQMSTTDYRMLYELFRVFQIGAQEEREFLGKDFLYREDENASPSEDKDNQEGM